MEELNLQAELARLKKENKSLTKHLREYKNRIRQFESQSHTLLKCTRGRDSLEPVDVELLEKALTIIVLGASGDLAKKKTFPALFSLHVSGLLPSHTAIYGFARSDLTDDDYKSRISEYFKGGDDNDKEEFLSRCFYVKGNSYDDRESFKKLHSILAERESKGGNRIFYMAIPPSVFIASGKCVKAKCMSKTGWNRVVVEKPFGTDLESSIALGKSFAKLFTENQLYRIDHYLGTYVVIVIVCEKFVRICENVEYHFFMLYEFVVADWKVHQQSQFGCQPQKFPQYFFFCCL